MGSVHMGTYINVLRGEDRTHAHTHVRAHTYTQTHTHTHRTKAVSIETRHKLPAGWCTPGLKILY